MNTVITKTIPLIINEDEYLDCLVDIHLYYSPDEYSHGYLFCPGDIEIEKIISVKPIDVVDFHGVILHTIEAGKNLIDLMTDENINQLECELMNNVRKRK